MARWITTNRNDTFEPHNERKGWSAVPDPNEEYRFSEKTIISTKVYPNRVTFSGPATIVFWSDGTKTIVKCTDADTWDWEKGLAMAICKKFLGENYRKTFKIAEKHVLEEMNKDGEPMDIKA